MLTRTLATLTLLLTFTTGGTDPTPRTAMHRDRAQAARQARIVDDDVSRGGGTASPARARRGRFGTLSGFRASEGCRVPAPSPVPVAPAACSDEGQP